MEARVVTRRVARVEMAAIPCSVPDCSYTTADSVDDAAAIQDKIAVLRIHADSVHGVVNAPVQHAAGP